MNFLLVISRLNEHILRNMLSTLSRLYGLLFSNNGIGQVLYHSISETPITGIYYNFVK